MSKWRPSPLNCIYVIPDLRGAFSLLKKICDRILPLRKSDGGHDRLVFLGNYVGRHAESYKVIDFLIELKNKYGEHVVFLRGANEVFLLRKLGLYKEELSIENFDDVFSIWLNNGGYETVTGHMRQLNMTDVNAYSLTSQRILDLIPETHKDFLDKHTVNYYQFDDFIFVHAGCDPSVKLENNENELFFFDRKLCNYVIRNIAHNKEMFWKKTIITGHNSGLIKEYESTKSSPVIHQKFMMLDCDSPNKLLVVELNSMDAFIAEPKKKRLVRYELCETRVRS